MEVKGLFLGLRVGEAGDGVEAAVVEIDTPAGQSLGPGSTFTLRGEWHGPLEDRLAGQLRWLGDLAGDPDGKIDALKLLGELDGELAEAAAEAGKTLLETSDLPADTVAASGLIGPVVLRDRQAVIEVGSPAVLADRLEVAVAGLFTRSDIAAGGQGVVPTAWCAWAWLRDERLSRVLVNLGGLGEIIHLPADSAADEVVASQTGPGTVLIDAVMRERFDRPFDEDGAVAAGGTVNPALLHELLNLPFYRLDRPRRSSLGAWASPVRYRLGRMAESHRCDGADLVATLTEMTARAVAGEIEALTERPHEVILTGGGAKNIHLAGRIRTLLSPSSTYPAERYGLSMRSAGATWAAILAAARLGGVRVYCPQATGAHRPTKPGGLWDGG